jgi:hypothetical protein
MTADSARAGAAGAAGEGFASARAGLELGLQTVRYTVQRTS